MSYDQALTQSATIVHRAATGQGDRHGNAALEEVGRDEGVPCFLQQWSSTEDTEGRDTVEADNIAFLMAGQAIGALDLLLKDGRTFTVVGTPERLFTPQGEHHVEALLREGEWTG